MEAPGAVDNSVTKGAIRPSTEVSEAIRIARVVCIFFMIFVHVNPGTAHFMPDEAGIRVFDGVRFFVVDSLGRASVALLSVVAGYLGVLSLRRESHLVFLRKKVRSLVLPLLLWNMIFISMVFVGAKLSAGYVQQSFGGDVTPGRLPNLLLSFTTTPANEPLGFLRDVFVCALLTPLLLFAVRRDNRLFLGTVFGLTTLAVFTPFLLTPSILTLYAVGVYIAERGRMPRPGLGLSLAAFAAFLVLGAVLSWRDMTSDEAAAGALTWLEAGFNAIRLPAALAFWSLALQLQRMRVGAWIAKLEPYVFTAFCAHLLITTLVWAGWQHLLGDYYDPAYPLFFLGMPVFVMACAVVGSHKLNYWTPWLYSLLNGGRGLVSARGRRAVMVGSAPPSAPAAPPDLPSAPGSRQPAGASLLSSPRPLPRPVLRD